MKETMIWPIYLDSEKSLGEGRKLSKEYCISEPRLKEIQTALDKLKYKYTLEPTKSYPGEWYNKSGRVIVSSEDSKKEILINISEKIKEQREFKSKQKQNKKNKKRR
ncbi:MAG: signal recognition particle subunit SRP19/SEC65 family protein [archaeon]|nr:signal recognition particle subunit SRP19/SEC65 family protein [archaeon]